MNLDGSNSPTKNQIIKRKLGTNKQRKSLFFKYSKQNKSCLGESVMKYNLSINLTELKNSNDMEAMNNEEEKQTPSLL